MAIVYYQTMRANIKVNLLDKIRKLLRKTETVQNLEPGRLVAIKLHFGEKGNTTYIRPVFIREIVDWVKKAGHKPFLTDTCTLYRSTREDAASHIETAITNGFAFSVVNAPIVIADGIKANDEIDVPIPGVHYQSVPIGSAIPKADAMVTISHFKAHEATGFGGAIKNLGMGCSTRKGKLMMHSTLAPEVLPKVCRGDKLCAIACSFDAISIVDKVAVVDREKCTGCGECIGVCPHKAIKIHWTGKPADLSEKMTEFALGAVKGKEDKCWYINFITQVSPACDCYGFSDAPIVPDLGIFASTDPVALDQACYDMVKASVGLPGTALKDNIDAGTDKFKTLYPDLDPQIQLAHGEKIGLGTRNYELKRLG